MRTRNAVGSYVTSTSLRPTIFLRRRSRLAWVVLLAFGIAGWTSNAPATCVAPPSGLVSWCRAENNGLDTIGGNHGTLLGGAARALWIGLNDAAQENIWQWISGAPATYVNWAPGEPNSGGGFFPDEDHALMWHPSSGFPLGSWNDAPSNQLQYAVVEVAPSPPLGCFHVATSFSTDSNPNGLWSYGYKNGIAGPLILNSEFGRDLGLVYWRSNLVSGIPAIWFNSQSTTQTNAAGTVVLAPGQLAIQPGPNGELGIIRFIAPSNGIYRVTGAYSGVAPQGTTTYVYLARNGATFFETSANGFGPGTSPAFNVSTSLQAGDNLEFVVTWGANQNSALDATGIAATICWVSDLPPPPPPPTIVTQPTNVTVPAGDTVIFYSLASGARLLTYQWWFKGFRLPGRTGSSLTLTNVQVTNAGLYSVVVTNSYGSVTSSPAMLTVTQPPTITSQPTNLAVYIGSNATFRVTATGGAPLAYQWRFHGTNLLGRTSSVLALERVQVTNSGPYSVIVSNAGGVVTSSNAILTVRPLPNCVPPPAGLVSWWRAEGDSTDNWGTNNGTSFGTTFAPGNVGQAFKVPRISASDALSLRATNGLTLEAWVNPISFMNPTPQTIISKFDMPFSTPASPQSAYLLGFTNNGRLFFTVSTTGSARTNATLVTAQTLPTNQWSFVVATYEGTALRIYLNGILAAQTNYSADIFPGTAPLGLGAIFLNAQASDAIWPFTGLLDEASLYNRALTDTEILALYNADLVGKCLVPATIVTQPQDQVVPLGEDVKFTLSATGSRPFRYQWRFNGTNLAGATNSALVLEKVQTSRAGHYSVIVSNAVGAVTSRNATLTLLPAPTCTEAPTGLISWWPGDSNLLDAMGTNNITSFSPTIYATGKVDRAFSFNGISSRIQVNNSASLNFDSNANFSIEMWIKAGASDLFNSNVPLFEKRTKGQGRAFWIGYSLSLNQGHLAFAMGSSPLSATNVSVFTSSGPDLRDGMFHHVAVTLNRSLINGGSLYVDGQLVLSFDPTSRSGSLVTTAPLYLGAPAITLGNSFFRGLIDEPAIYNRALSATEILAIRNAGAAGKCKTPPVILVQPASQRVTVGSNATFSVTAVGKPRLRYQWLRNGQGLLGETNSSFTITKVSFASNPGPYSCRVTNLFGSAVSSNAVLTVRPPPVCVPPPAGLVSWWRSEGDAGDNWSDNHGTTSAWAFGAGKVGRGFASPTVTVPDAASLRVTGGLTLEAWVNPSATSGTSARTIVSKFGYSTWIPVGNQNAYWLGTTNNGRVFFTISTASPARTNMTLVTSQALPTNQWSFVVATYDGARLRLYLDGVLVGSVAHAGGISPGTAPLGIGGIPGTSGRVTYPPGSYQQFTSRFMGLLDEVSLYNRALTDAEILAIYDADVLGKCLVAPTFVTPPQDQASSLGELVKFTASVRGTRPLTYQWRFNGTNLAGATRSALVFELLQTNRVGHYSVFVSNALGTATSSNAALTLLPPPGCTDSPAGLISWWPFDGSLSDVMGTNNATIFGSASYVSGKVDRTISPGGSFYSSDLQVNNSPSLNFGTNADFSIEAWIKLPQPVPPIIWNPGRWPITATDPIVEKRSYSASGFIGFTDLGYSLYLNEGRLACWLGASSSRLTREFGSDFISSGADLRDALYHHVALSLTRSATNGGKLYVDGEEVLTFDPTAQRGDLSNTGPLMIGSQASSGWTIIGPSASALIDEPAIYSRALTAAEIRAIRNAGAAGKCKTPPSILVQPASQRVTVGSNAIFRVTAAGTPRLRYQWLRDGQSLPGATNSTYTITNVSSATSRGPYSCRVTNLFGLVVSSNAVLTVNYVPFAVGRNITLNEDTATKLLVSAIDQHFDPLTFIVVTPPQHGTLSPFVISPGNVAIFGRTTYKPAPNYNGPDSFTFKVNDGLVDSAPANVNLTIRPVNDPPEARSQHLTLDEDTPTPITLGAFDVENDPLTFTVGPPAHGALTGTPPNLTYRPATNYFGPDGFTFRVNDGQANSQIAIVILTVRPLNDPPVPKIVVSPLTQLPGFSNLVVVAPVCGEARVILDGSQSGDVEHDRLHYTWLEGTNTLGTTAMVTNRFAPGRHTITLRVSDGRDSAVATRTFVVVTPEAAVHSLAVTVAEADLGHWQTAPLLATLQVAAEAFERCRPVAGIMFLKVFQHQVHVLVAPSDPALAELLIQTTEEILNLVAGGDSGRGCAVFDGVARLSNGPLRLTSSAPKSRNYFVQATTNMMDWETIGVAEARGDGTFLFDDPSAGQHARRFYRIASE